MSSAANAAIIAGRVVDAEGRPVVGAEVRVWQKLPNPEGQGVSDQPVRFAADEGGNVLRTDAEGRFQTPDVVVPDAFARVFADAEGMLTARGDWLEIRQETSPHVIEVGMRRLRNVAGQVLDRQQRPIEGAAVFHVGDSPGKIETKTDPDGRFRLPGVPEGRVFVFAEKPGYRFTGKLLTDDRDAAIVLSRIDEAIEPLKSLPPLLPHDEELALARRVIERALDAAKLGTPEQKKWALRALAELDPIEAFDRAEAYEFHSEPQRGSFNTDCVRLCIEGRGKLSWDDLQAFIESSNNQIALRPPRPVEQFLDDESERIDLHLIGLLSRYDRRLARSLLEPYVDRLDDFADNSRTECAPLVVAAAGAIDPAWAAQLLERLPDAKEAGPASVRNRARWLLVHRLSMHGAWRGQAIGYRDLRHFEVW